MDNECNWIVYGVENHPDKLMGPFYGPYTEDEAEAKAKELYDAAENYNAPYHHRLYLYYAVQLIS